MHASDSEGNVRGGIQRFLPQWLVRDVILPFVASRLALIVIAWLGFHLLQIPLKGNKWEVENDGYVHRIAGHLSADAYPFVNMWARWDSGWYLDIAEHGYSFVPGKQSNVAFFPLYPDLIRLFHFVVPLPRDVGWLNVGIILSNLALLVALVYLYRLVRLDYERRTAARAVLYLCVFPTTLFLSAVYSESLFLALVVAAFYYARTTRWLAVGALSAAAAICRPPGVLLVLPLAFEYLSQREFQWRRIKPDCLALILPLLAIAGHLTFLRWRFGEWDVIEKAQINQGWNRTLTFPWNTIIHSFHEIDSFQGFHGSFEFFFTIALFGLVIFACFRLSPSYAIYAAVSLLFITSWGTLLSTPRFGVVIFPVVIGLALLGENKLFHSGFLVVSALLAAVSMVVFSEWGWVA
jgi:Gpi18-like mannosyltransferase